MKLVVHSGEAPSGNEWQEKKEAKNKPWNDENMGEHSITQKR